MAKDLATTPADMPSIVAIGNALFGNQWQSAMARALGKAVNTTQRWADGSRNPGPAARRELLELMRDRRDELIKLIAALEAALEARETGAEPDAGPADPDRRSG